MFTGIIEEVGEIVAVTDTTDFRTIRVRAREVLTDSKVGSSIAVNGVCLTAITVDNSGFTAELSRETLVRSSLNGLGVGTVVNLERPMRADGRFGGHIVQGHVDGVGRIRSFERDGDSWSLVVEYPKSASQYLVEKGSITLDGISLTIAALRPDAFDVAIIPHTLDNTNLGRAKAGDPVNLEFDVIAKYVERMLKRE